MVSRRAPLCFQQVELGLHCGHACELDLERLLNGFDRRFDTIQSAHRLVDVSDALPVRVLPSARVLARRRVFWHWEGSILVWR